MPGNNVRIRKVKLLVIDPGIDDSLTWEKNILGSFFANVESDIFSVQPGLTLRSLRKELLSRKIGSYTHWAYPLRARYLLNIYYWIYLLLSLTCNRDLRYLKEYKELGKFSNSILPLFVPLHPFISLLLILRSPYYWITQIGRYFILDPENPEDEIVGYGSNKGSGGLVFWLTLVKKARQFGLFGVAHDTYWGVPMGVHNWPFAVWALDKLGYRKYTYLSAVLFSTSLILIALRYDVIWVVFTLPFILGSPFFIYNIYVGTWELLAWGLGALAISLAGFSPLLALLAGIAIGLSLMTHPGVTVLTVATILGLAILGQISFLNLVVSGVMAFACSFWFIIPYYRSRDHLARDLMINTAWQYKPKWTIWSAYQFLMYAAFCISVFWISKGPIGNQLIVVLPLIVLFLNTKIRWVFSQYTVMNFMLMIGTQYLYAFPHPISILFFALVIFSSPVIIWIRADRWWEFDLNPIRLNDTRAKIQSLFKNLQSGRVAFEYNGFGSVESYLIGTLSYILADQQVELFNSSYAEIGGPELYKNFTQFLNRDIREEDFKSICISAGIKYIVALTSEFRTTLDARGYQLKGSIDNISLLPWPENIKSSIAIYELPWHVELSTPTSNIIPQKNRLEFHAKAGEHYVLKYTCFRGWRAFQDDKQIPIHDANPGIEIVAPSDGVVTLRYRYLSYLS